VGTGFGFYVGPDKLELHVMKEVGKQATQRRDVSNCRKKKARGGHGTGGKRKLLEKTMRGRKGLSQAGPKTLEVPLFGGKVGCDDAK